MSRYREGGAGADVTTNHLEARCIVENLRAGVGTLLHADSLEDAPPFTSEPSSRGVSALTSTDLHFLATRAGARLLALANGMSNKASVAITCDSSWPLVVSMFACTLVGLPFVPVDLAHPVNRLADILTVVAPCAAIIFERASLPAHDSAPLQLASVVQAKAVSIDELVADGSPVASLGIVDAVVTDATTPCYLVFTSGSTGRPKGVVCSHAAIGTFACAKAAADRLLDVGDVDKNSAPCLSSALCHEAALQPPVKEKIADNSERPADHNVVLLVAAHTFDLTHGDVYATAVAMTYGRSSLAAPHRARTRANLVDVINIFSATHLSITPAVWLLAGAQAGQGPAPHEVPTMRCINLGGEPLPPRVAAQWHGIFRSRPGNSRALHPVLRNIYGCTEGTVVQCFDDIVDGDAGRCVGRPYSCATILVVAEDADGEDDLDLHICQPGERGRIVVGGGGLLGCGYATHEEPLFVMRPPSRKPAGSMGYLGTHPRHGPLFDTGDLGRMVSSIEGENCKLKLHLNGRTDDMVKVHGGNRVHLGDVESALRALPIVSAAVCTCLPEYDGSLSAHVALVEIMDPHSGNDDEELEIKNAWAYRSRAFTAMRARLTKVLPIAHIPSVWLPMGGKASPHVPYTESGKLDRNVLRERHMESMRDRSSYTTASEVAFLPTDTLEETIAQTWADSLGLAALPGSNRGGGSGFVGAPDDITARPNFIHLGGTSLHALRCSQMLVQRLDASEDVRLDVSVTASATHYIAEGIGLAGDRATAAAPIQAGPACAFGDALGVLAPHELLRRPDFDEFVAYVRSTLGKQIETGTMASPPSSKASDDLDRALTWACARGYPRLVASLIGAGAGSGEHAANDALLAACASGHPNAERVVRMLVHVGASPLAIGSESAHVAFARGHSAVVRELLCHIGTAEGCAELLSRCDAAGRTPIHYAAMCVDGIAGVSCLMLANASVKGEGIELDARDDAHIAEECHWLSCLGIDLTNRAEQIALVIGKIDDATCLWNAPDSIAGDSPTDAAAMHGNVAALTALRSFGGQARNRQDLASMLLSSLQETEDRDVERGDQPSKTRYANSSRSGLPPMRAARKESDDSVAVRRLLEAVCDATKRVWQRAPPSRLGTGTPDLRSATETLRNLVCANAANRSAALDAGAADELMGCVACLVLMSGCLERSDSFESDLVKIAVAFVEKNSEKSSKYELGTCSAPGETMIGAALIEILGILRNLAFGAVGGKSELRHCGAVPVLCELANRGLGSERGALRMEVGRKAAAALMSLMQGDAVNRDLVSSYPGTADSISHYFQSGRKADSATLVKLQKM